MTRPVLLNRLRDISKQRSIRRPLLVHVQDDAVAAPGNFVPTKIEWPLSS